jgi:Niemann-Pick C1 protein
MLKFPRLVQLVLLVLAVDKIRGDCVWYGECGPSMNDGVYNCKYDGKPKLFNEDIETQNQLKSLCPHLFNGINQTYTCCAKDQLETLATSMSVPQQLMSRCPACYTNFRAFLCDLTCNPNMHEFLLVTDDEPYKSEKYPEVTKQVKSVTYHISNASVELLYDACKGVQYSATGQTILDLLCGSQKDGCTPERFVEYLGNNAQSPFIFTMNITDEGYEATDVDGATVEIIPANTTLHSCSKNIDMTWYQAPACGCSDCEDSCPKPIPPPEEKKCLVWGIDCLALIMTGVFVVCSASFLVGLLISNKRSSRRESEGLIRRDGLKILFFFFWSSNSFLLISVSIH